MKVRGYIALVDGHMSKEEGEQKYSYVRAVNVGIRHNDYLSVTEL